MKAPVPTVKLVEHPIETIQGLVPVPFPPSPLMAPNSCFELVADFYRDIEGPYLFRFNDPEGIRVASIRCANCSVEGNGNSYDAQQLIANTESAVLGDQFFPIDGPKMPFGSCFKVIVQNTSKKPRVVELTIYARPGTAP